MLIVKTAAHFPTLRSETLGISGVHRDRSHLLPVCPFSIEEKKKKKENEEMKNTKGGNSKHGQTDEDKKWQSRHPSSTLVAILCFLNYFIIVYFAFRDFQFKKFSLERIILFYRCINNG